MNHGLFRAKIALRLCRGVVLADPLYYFTHKLVFALERCYFRWFYYIAARRRLHNNSTYSSISLIEVHHSLSVNKIIIRWHLWKYLQCTLTFLIVLVVELFEPVHVKLESGLALITLRLQLLSLLCRIARVDALKNSNCRQFGFIKALIRVIST